MGRRGDLLALVDRSPGPLRTLEGAVTTWLQRDLVSTITGSLSGVLAAGWGGTEAGRDSTGGAGRGGVAGSSEVASTAYVVIDLPARWRVIERGHVAVCDGERSWAGTASLVTERSADQVALEDAGIVGVCLFPGRLLGSLVFGDPVPGEAGGRECWVVDARLRPGTHGGRSPAAEGAPAAELTGEHLPGLLGVDHRFWFDAATGIVLRHEGAVDGQPCSTVELTDLRVDRPVAPAEFGPPPDAIVRSRDELLRDHLVSVGVDPDGIDLDDPVEVRDALRSGLALDPCRAQESRRDNHVPVSSGPDDPAAARAAVREAIERLTEADELGGLPNVQAGRGLAAVYEAARARVPGNPVHISLVVDDCLFLSDDRAVVWYSVLLDGKRPPVVRAREGYAVRIDGRWVMERASFADLVSLAGVPCPPPVEP